MPKTLKELIETRNSKVAELDTIKEAAKTRAISEEENTQSEGLMTEIRSLDTRIKLLETETRSMDLEEEIKDLPVSEELRSFLKNPNIAVRYGKGANEVFKLSDAGQGGVIMPKTLSDKIIEKVLEESQILPLVTKYTLTGQLIIPKFDRSTIEAGFYDEFVEVIESNAGFTSITISAHRVSSLIKISKQLINNVAFDIESFLVNQLALRFKEFLEKTLIQGSPGKFDALFNATPEKTITLAVKGKWDIDALVDLQIKLPSVYQTRAVFVMNKTTLATLRKLKDANGHYYVLPDVTQGFGYQILNTRIITSDFAPDNQVLYADLSCYGLGVSAELQLQSLVEKYATQYAVGALADGEFGGKLIDDQGFALLKDK